jgi:hypothetical protein
MLPSDATPPHQAPDPVVPPAEPPTGPRPPGEQPARSGRVWSLALGAGLVGGLLGWLTAEAAILLVKPETAMFNAMGVMIESVTRQGEIKALATRAHLSFGLLGAWLGLALGLAGGLARRSARQAMIAGLAGLVAGGIVGASASMALVPVYQAHRDANPGTTDLTVPMLVLGGIWVLVGASGGLAFGLGLGGKGRIAGAMVGGLIGAAFGTLAFAVIGATAFPLDKTHLPISESWPSRLAARLSVALLAALGIGAMLTREPTRRPASPPPAPPAS